MSADDFKGFAKNAKVLLSSLSARRARNLYFGVDGEKWIFTNSQFLEFGYFREGSGVIHVVEVLNKEFEEKFRRFFKVDSKEVVQLETSVVSKAINNANCFEAIQVKRKKNELLIHYPKKKMKQVDAVEDVEYATEKYGHIHEYYGEKETLLSHIREYTDGAFKKEAREGYGAFPVEVGHFPTGPTVMFRFSIDSVKRGDGEPFFKEKYDVSTVFHDGLDVPSWKECWKKFKDSRATVHVFVPLNTLVVCFLTEYKNSLFECMSFRPLFSVFPLDKKRVEVIYGKRKHDE